MDTDRYFHPLRPAVLGGRTALLLGICTALLLGTTGFGLGCLYGQVIAAPVSVPTLPAVALVAAPRTAKAFVTAPEPLRTAGQGLDMERPVVGGWVSSRYGQRTDPFTGRPAVHRGLDFAGMDNSPILAASSGVVTRGGREAGYGNFIEIDHGHGWVTRYGHNATNLVTAGDYVKPGQTIALMGSTGRATGTHLHFEVLYRGRRQDPARLLPRDT